MEKQRTIKEKVTYSGIGLHTGNETSITFCPAPENYGYKFIRTDLPEHVEIEAVVDNVVDLSRGTTLGIGEVKVHTVEHVLASLVGLRIDNCRIELSGNEPPVGDGSSMPYVEALLKAGFDEQTAERVYFNIDETIRYTNEEKGVDIVALPTDDFRVTVMVDYYNPALGSQHTGLFNLDKEFISEFAPARTFCFLAEVEMLREHGLIKGGSLDSAVVIVDKDLTDEESKKLMEIFNLSEPPFLGENGVLNNVPLRYKNEPARHKLLDMLGDMALAGVQIKAQVLAARPGHASNIEFAKKIRALWKKQIPAKKQIQKETKKSIMDIYDLMKIMPHRYPFLLIDKIVEMDTVNMTITGIKNVTFNEPYFIGHFPNKPIMPGVLICEALAQTGCMLIMKTVEDYSNLLVLYLGIKNAKFRKPVIPGDVLVMDVQMTGKKFNTYSFKGTASINGVVATEIEFQAATVEKNYE
jgi:UDP-3-O-[3-hydroxymyristoyl] N-acetylglucosamine deacetylase/3-hydroxyacyl-[acyl-carrier-protein] dehydratase